MRRHALQIFAFPAAAFLLSLVTSSVSAELGVANIAIALAVITTLAGISSWPSGLATSIVAAVSLNYFHTRPVHSLRIGSGSDILMVALLGGIGVMVSFSTVVRARRRVLQLEHTARMESVEHLSDMLLAPTPTASTWHAAIDATDHALRLTNVRLEPVSDAPIDVPLVARPLRTTLDGAETRDHVLLPEQGALVTFRDPRLLQRLRVTPASGAGPLLVDRSALFQLSDAIELVLARSFNGTGAKPAD